jgi:hypothetical protein
VVGTKQKYVCVSRPRRFGKSMAEEMLEAYYTRGIDTHAKFAPFEIASHPSYEQHINKYNVVSLNIHNFLTMAKNDVTAMTALIEKWVIRDLRKDYDTFVEECDNDLCNSLKLIDDETGVPFIFVIDEWDCIFRVFRKNTKKQNQYLDFLRYLFKDNPAIHLVYMTGILPIKKYGIHSALNMFTEFSMTSQGALARFTGFTQEEVDALCEKFGRDREMVRKWYDGYQLTGQQGERYEIYNPKAVVEAMLTGRYAGYWTKTETYEALKVYIDLNMDGLRDRIVLLLSGERQKVDTANFTNDMVTFTTADDVLTLLVHLGYLGYDSDTKEVFIPNKEIADEYVVSMRTGVYSAVAKAVHTSQKLLEAVWAGDEAAVAAGVEQAHFETSHLTYNDENALSYVLSIAFYAAREYYTVFRELPTGKGYADLAFIPLPQSVAATPNPSILQSPSPSISSIPQSLNPSIFSPPAVLIELKWDATAEGALAQIAERRYPEALAPYADNLLLVGINYDKATKTHTCKITQQ